MQVNEAEKQEMLNKKDDMIKMYCAGHGCNAVAKHFGFSCWKTTEFLKRHILLHRKTKISKERAIEIVKAYKSGLSSLILSKKYKVSHTIIIKYLRREGVKIKSRGSKGYRKHAVNKLFFKRDLDEKFL